MPLSIPLSSPPGSSPSLVILIHDPEAAMLENSIFMSCKTHGQQLDMKYKEKSMIRGTGEEIGGNECKVPISCYVAIQFLMASKL